MKLSIVIPAFNEVESLSHLFKEIEDVCQTHQIDYEVLVVDDGSRDGTFDEIEKAAAVNPKIRGLRFRANCGKAAALAVGFRESRGDYIITMDGDLQDNPSEIPGLIGRLEAGADMVSGWKQKRYDPWHKTLPSKLFNSVLRIASGLPLHDFNCGLKAYKREVTQSLTLYGELHRYIPVLANWNGFRVEEQTVHHRERRFGKSKYGFARLFNGFFDLITLLFLHRFTARPLHLFGLVGLLFSGLGTLILLYFAGVWIVTHDLHIRPLMLGGIASIIVGIQFVSLGLLAEMLNQRFAPRDFPVGRFTKNFGNSST